MGGEVIPDGAPFASSPYAKSGRDGMVQFAKGQIDKSGEGDICKQFAYADDVYGRAFFSHPLPCYSVGWAMLDLTKERPHYNTKKMKEKEAELQRNGKEVDYSARKRFFLFPESIKEIGLMLKMNGKPQALEIAQSSDTWDIEPIEGSFFTFTPDRGSVFGSSSSGPEQSLPFPLKPHHSDSQLFADVRWSRLQLEFLRLLRKQGDTTSVFKLEVCRVAPCKVLMKLPFPCRLCTATATGSSWHGTPTKPQQAGKRLPTGMPNAHKAVGVKEYAYTFFYHCAAQVL